MGTNVDRWFAYEHLPSGLQEVSKAIADVADLMNQNLSDSDEKSAGMRKLLEAKDCFVRAAIAELESEDENGEGEVE